MTWALLLVGGVLLAAGLAFMLVAAIGFVRLPDVFCRLHVTGINDTMGAPLVLLAIAVWTGWNLASGKLLLGLLFLLVTSPLVGHLLSLAAHQSMDEHAPPTVDMTRDDRPREGEARP